MATIWSLSFFAIEMGSNWYWWALGAVIWVLLTALFRITLTAINRNVPYNIFTNQRLWSCGALSFIGAFLAVSWVWTFDEPIWIIWGLGIVASFIVALLVAHKAVR